MKCSAILLVIKCSAILLVIKCSAILLVITCRIKKNIFLEIGLKGGKQKTYTKYGDAFQKNFRCFCGIFLQLIALALRASPPGSASRSLLGGVVLASRWLF